MATAGWWTGTHLWLIVMPGVNLDPTRPSCGGFFDAKNLRKTLLQYMYTKPKGEKQAKIHPRIKPKLAIAKAARNKTIS